MKLELSAEELALIVDALETRHAVLLSDAGKCDSSRQSVANKLHAIAEDVKALRTRLNALFVRTHSAGEGRRVTVPDSERPDEPETRDEDLSRNAVIARIKAALEKRSKKRWSVTGGRGTAYGWIRISAMPSECKFAPDGEAGGSGMNLERRKLLAKLLGLEGPCNAYGVSIPASDDYYREYIDRAEGREPRKIAEQYWD